MSAPYCAAGWYMHTESNSSTLLADFQLAEDCTGAAAPVELTDIVLLIDVPGKPRQALKN